MARQKPRFLICWLSILLAVWLFRSDRSFAQRGKPVIYSYADYTFGQTMHFHLTVEQADNIVSVFLHFRAPEFTDTFSVELPFSAGDRIDVVHGVELSQVRLAPFTTVTYWWTMVTDDGEEILAPEQTIPYDDSRFNWQHESRSGLSVHWTGNDPDMGRLVMDIVSEAMPVLQKLMPESAGTPLRLYIYPSSADLRAALRLTGLDWVGVHADPQPGAIMVTAVNTRTAAIDLRQRIPHELVHFLLYRTAGSKYDELPVWFNEGLATYLEPVTNPNYQPLLEEAIASQTTIPFSELCASFPEVEKRALLAYAQSASLINYIQTRYGDRKLAELVRTFADGANCQSGTGRALQTNLIELERTWLLSQQPRSPLVQYLSRHGLWLLLLLAGFVMSRTLMFNPAKRR